MGGFKSKPLLVAMLFLAIILQGLLPFLHAHTGVSNQAGLHMHGASATSQPAGAIESVILSGSNGESPEVGVPMSRQNEQFSFDIPDLFSFILSIIPLLIVYAYRTLLSIGIVYPIKRSQTQNSLPPALAPPLALN